jgi:NADH:ubiquinone oxidoreductase subunit 3 (subunit A)
MPAPTLLTLYGYVGVMVLVAVGFAMAPMILAMLVRPSRPNPVKLSTYECGMETIGPTWIQYHVGFYIYALIFVIFDVETVFLYPWALAYGKLGLFAFAEMAVFIAILVVGLVYALKKRVLRWW